MLLWIGLCFNTVICYSLIGFRNYTQPTEKIGSTLGFIFLFLFLFFVFAIYNKFRLIIFVGIAEG